MWSLEGVRSSSTFELPLRQVLTAWPVVDLQDFGRALIGSPEDLEVLLGALDQDFSELFCWLCSDVT